MTTTERQQAIATLIAAKLELIRAELHLKRYALAHGRMSPNTITRILSGKDHHVSTMIELADAMGCDVLIEFKPREILPNR